MSRARNRFLKAALTAMHLSGVDSLLSPWTSGVGVIFMLHRVRPSTPDGFGPNRILEVEPKFLDDTIELVKRRGFDILSLDDVHMRLSEGDFDRPFACFTFDDGYRDNREYAYPIFRRHGLPFAIYVPTDYADGHGDLWWIKLEMVIGAITRLEIKLDGTLAKFDLTTRALKDKAFDRVYWWLRSIPEIEARRIVDELCDTHGVDASQLCAQSIMSWPELRDLASDPLVTIGAHTRNHFALAKLTRAQAHQEMFQSIARLESELQCPIRHFSYPYGDAGSAGPREFDLARELGLATAVTTRKGVIRSRHTISLTGLPRLSLNGEFQNTRYVKVLMSGAPFALMNMAPSLPTRGEAA